MPELPEVEAIARTLRPLVRGQTIRRCQVLHSIAVRPQSPAELRRGAEGQRIEGVERRGKYLLWRLGRGCLLMHFKLDGQLDRKSTRLNSSHRCISYAVFCLKKKKIKNKIR